MGGQSFSALEIVSAVDENSPAADADLGETAWPADRVETPRNAIGLEPWDQPGNLRTPSQSEGEVEIVDLVSTRKRHRDLEGGLTPRNSDTTVVPRFQLDNL
jgi:hypothetical protein